MDRPDEMMNSGPAAARPVPAAQKATRTGVRLDWIWDILLIGVLLAGFYFRSVGINWDQDQHLHPDERFLTMVETSIDPVKSLGDYFNTAESSLNPNNRGYGFYVYGDLPLFVVRYVGEWLGKTGYDEINLVGRQLSGIMDLGTVLLVYLIAYRLYRKRWLAFLASAFAAFSVLPIQLSHYATVDTFTNFFGMLAFYFAVRLLPQAVMEGAPDSELVAAPEQTAEPKPSADPYTRWLTDEWRSAWPYLLFGAALGLAMACKINAVLLAILLPGAALLRFIALPPSERGRWFSIYLRNLVIGGVACLILFRIFQPYAFSGPGFFGITPNPRWLETMRDLSNQSTGDVDFPPALQWARRPITFALQNMVVWGLGVPLGVLAWAAFLWMGYRMLRGEWRQHLILWAWTGLYFVYQSYNWTRSMRYQMLVYPTLAIIAAWGISALASTKLRTRDRQINLRPLGVLLGILALGLTAAWAFAFTRIYTRPVTRVAASQWIYQNVPGPINLHLSSGSEIINQPVAFRSGYNLTGADAPLAMAFRPQKAGLLTAFEFEHLGAPNNSPGVKNLRIVISESPDGGSPLSEAFLSDTFASDGSDPRGKSFTATFGRALALDPTKTYYLVFTVGDEMQIISLAGAIQAVVQAEDGNTMRQALPEPVEALHAGKWYKTTFAVSKSGTLSALVLDHVVDWQASPEPKTLRISIHDGVTDQELGAAELRDPFTAQQDVRGQSYTLKFDHPIELDAHHNYAIRLSQVDGPGMLAIYGRRQANESSWDDALPLGLDGYNPYDYFTGVYRSDLNFEMYWDDDPAKLQRFLSILNQADDLFLSSNRQWGTTVRVPERYPLTSVYYRQLLGCPDDKEITWCYSVAQPGMFKGNLGFDLVAVFQSDPTLGSLRFNSQFAEEAFTVYDAPKVMIFKKTADYNPDKVKAILGAVDLSTVQHLTPRKASGLSGNLLLPLERLSQQRAGGTWADLFHPDALYNQQPWLAAVIWYLVITLLGIVMVPFTRLALHGLPDRGYPFARLVGLLALAYPVWLLGSAKVSFSALTISAVFAGLVLLNLVLGYSQRKVLLMELRERWKYYLLVELLFLAFFLLFLLVRWGNPDLWHPYKGGEKPMDFSYFNAVLKSTTFPPYDPWFAGGYINYYYYGFVIIGVPVKWLGIVPAIAYNLILPTLFAMLALGAFSIDWNLLSATRAHVLNKPSDGAEHLFERRGPFFAGLFSALAVVMFGNWGTVRMVWQGLQKLSDAPDINQPANMITRIAWAFAGLERMMTNPGLRLPYGPGEWYWIPSRAIPGEPITEFPAFTFLYADPHAHMIALPITVLALAWALSVLLGRWGWKGWGHLGISFALGGLVIGALRPTNTWDWPTYLAIGCVTVAYTALRYGQACCLNLPGVSPRWKRVIIAVAGVAALLALSTLLYQPFSTWYGQGYNKIDPWSGDHTPFWSYMTHWGVFLFVIVSWLAWETIDWMATTPVSALNRLRPYRRAILLAVLLLVLFVIGLLLMEVSIAWLVLPLAAWAGILLLRPRMHDAKRAVLFMTGVALVLTLFVEVAVLRGDIGRMNTVFKFYLQAWVLLGLSAGASLVWLLPAVSRAWQPGLRHVWQPAVVLLALGIALFPITAAVDKINDRMASDAPHTLDGMAYMPYSTYQEGDTKLDLSEDYKAIQWMQRSVQGSPVIVEANVPEYRWGTRFTIYTGLPGVVGWNWHQRQQRAVTPSEWVTNRVDSVKAFYNTVDRAETEQFLRRYAVRYIIVGQLERAVSTRVGIQKFADWNGSLWREVYQNGQTAIYEVIQ